MPGTPTHFEIYGEDPSRLAEFYRAVLGWDVEQMPGLSYWRVHTGSGEGREMHGGLTHRAIEGMNGWMMFVHVSSVDEAAALVERHGGTVVRPKTAVPRTAWVTVVADPERNIFGMWQADPNAFPIPVPD